MLQNIAIYPYERDVFYREEGDNCYSVEAFMLQYTVLEVPFEIVTSLIFGIMAAFAIGLERSAKMTFISAFNCFCITSCGESLGIMFCTLFDHVGFSVQVTSVMLSISMVMGGIMSPDVPDVLRGINYISPVMYSVSNMAPYTMKDRVFTCSDAQRLPNGSCPIETGEQVLDLYNQDKNAAMHIMGLGLCAVAYRLVAYALIKVRRRDGLWDAVRTKLLGRMKR